MDVVVYTDGSSKGNPGPGGYGIIIRQEDKDGNIIEHEYSESVAYTTNNRMEMTAVIVALESIKTPCDITVVTDSEYVVNPFNKYWLKSWERRGWKTSTGEPVKNLDLWQRLIKAVEFHKSVSFIWVKGHSVNKYNDRCDKLATAAADKITRKSSR